MPNANIKTNTTKPVQLIFFRDKRTEKICACHLNKFESKEATERAVAMHNNNPDNRSVVSVVEADDYMKYLYDKLIEKMRYPQEIIDEIINDLESAISSLQCLKPEEEK